MNVLEILWRFFLLGLVSFGGPAAHIGYFHPASSAPALAIRVSYTPLILFTALFLLVPFFAGFSEWIALFNTFFQSGSLVFGGGHVVLPLLQQSLGDAIAMLAIFLPGFLLVLGLYRGWEALAQRPRIAAAAAGLNAAVVGILLAALYDPVFTSAVTSSADMALIVIGFFLFRTLKIPVVSLLPLFAIAGIFL